MREKIKLKIMKIRQQKTRVRARFLVLAGITIGASLTPVMDQQVEAESCPDLRVVFVRGSGAERWNEQNYLEFKKQTEGKLPDISYEFLDLDYPAIGIDSLEVAAGAFFGAGEAYDFGDSVDKGVQELKRVVNSGCSKTKYVLGGYSQGAMVISKALPELNAEKIIYAATFGDPKIYLPEGLGLIPPACSNRNLSDYRAYVPDCRAYRGLLGSHEPYQPKDFVGKLGTWCNKYDIFCSSHFSVSSHTSYVADDLYEDASRVVASKVAAAFNVQNKYSSPHDTAILIDSTGSMTWMIEQFRTEAMRLANETFDKGGRVALYDYRDLGDPYKPTARCTFETCTAENFAELLDSITLDGGGDEPESLLSASISAMGELKWRRGATKSLVILTDAPFVSPDRDGTTTQDVISLSRRIDPVNIYIITSAEVANIHPEIEELTTATDGAVVTDFGSLDLLTDQIMARYDTLPRTEEDLAVSDVMPTLQVDEFVDSGENVTVKFKNSENKTIVILNDAILGISNTDSIIIGGLNRAIKNKLVLIPVSDITRGDGVTLEIPAHNSIDSDGKGGEIFIPKVPDTGIVK